MNSHMPRRMAALAVLLISGGVWTAVPAQAAAGTEEFGMSPRELVESVEKVEAAIARCMREQGFEYVAADYETVRNGMRADKRLPGVSEEEFIDRFGYGVATMYNGLPPQLQAGYSPGKVGLGERNVAIYQALPPASQVAYTRALFGRNPDATFAIALERENFSRVDGCTKTGVAQVFTAEQMAASYYNPTDAQINRDPRMQAALRKYAQEMRRAGFDYDHPDGVEPDVIKRLNALTQGQTIAPEQMSPDQRRALKELQDYERRVARKNFELVEKLFDPVEEQIAKEMFARGLK